MKHNITVLAGAALLSLGLTPGGFMLTPGTAHSFSSAALADACQGVDCNDPGHPKPIGGDPGDPPPPHHDPHTGHPGGKDQTQS
jgi:hypothetical protein